MMQRDEESQVFSAVTISYTGLEQRSDRVRGPALREKFEREAVALR